jgi:hypothetical protein
MKPLLLVSVAALLGSAACRSGDVDAQATAPVAAAASPALAAAPPPAAEANSVRSKPIAPLAPEPWHVPVGPTLLIEPGKGVGPIRFGARLETIERLMGEPCEQKRAADPQTLVCRYSAQAVEFVLTDGVLTSVSAHRLGRPFVGTNPKPDFGIFNGRFAAGATLGMLMAAVQEFLGKPKAVRSVKEVNPYGTVEIHDYAGFSLQYDRIDGDRVVLGGVRLTAPEQPRSKSMLSR